MWLYHPDYLRGLRKLCDEHELLLIVDEIATGFGRPGKMFSFGMGGPQAGYPLSRQGAHQAAP